MTHNSTALTDLAGTGAAPGAPYLDFGARLYSPGMIGILRRGD